MSKKRIVDNELVKCEREIIRRIDDLIDAVDVLKVIQGKSTEINDALTEQAASHTTKLAEMERHFADDRLGALIKYVAQMGKVTLNKTEFDELQNQSTTLKQNFNALLEQKIADERAKFDEKLANSLQIKQFEYDRDTAKLVSQVEQYKQEVINKEVSLQRMAAELDSQKKLTADIARVNVAANVSAAGTNH